MALFSRRRPDPDLPALDASAADRIRGLVGASLAALGIEATVDGDHADTSLGELGLAPVARECADQDRKAWPYLVDEIVKRMVRSLIDGASQLSDVTIGSHVVWRLLPDAERMGRSFRYVRQVAGSTRSTDAVVALAWDGEESLDLLNDSALAEVHDLDAAFDAGRRNLLADMEAAPIEVAPRGDGILEITSPSWLTASWALLPGELATRFLPGLTGEILLAAPDHHHLLIARASEVTETSIAEPLGDTPVLAVTAFQL